MIKMKIGEYNVEVRRSKRKSAAIKITADMQIVVFVPLYVSDNEIERLVISKSKWIDEHMLKVQSTIDERSKLEKITFEQIKELADQAVEYIWERFAETYFGNDTKEFLNEWKPIKEGLNHKPFNPESEDYKKFINDVTNKYNSFAKKWGITK